MERYLTSRKLFGVPLGKTKEIRACSKTFSLDPHPSFASLFYRFNKFKSESTITELLNGILQCSISDENGKLSLQEDGRILQEQKTNLQGFLHISNLI